MSGERLYPSCDLHFYVGAPGVQMRAFGRGPGGWGDLSTAQNFTMQLTPVPPAPSPAIVTLSGTRIDPGVEGVQLATLGFSSPDFTPPNLSVAIRATVHHELRALFLPVSALTLETGRSDRVLTVYGQFADAGGALSTFDITRHDYLQYAITPSTGASDAVASVNDGRITTGSAAGTSLITVSATGGPSVLLAVTVVAPPTEREIKRLFEGAMLRKRSVLFVSEGFTAAEQPRFETTSRELAVQLFQHTAPYDVMRESFDVYALFAPSAECGVTLGPPIVPVASPNSTLSIPVGAELPLSIPGVQSQDFTLEELVNRLQAPTSVTPPLTFAQARAAMGNAGNLALSQVTFDTWQLLSNLPPQARVRETAFGFMLGERHYSTAISLRDGSTNLDVMFELLASRVGTRTPWFDDRRLPDLVAGVDPNTAHVEQQDRLVRTLRPPGGAAGFGAVWASGGDSFGLVVYVVNHDYFGGLGQEGYVGLSTGAGVVLSVVPSMAVAGLFDVEPVPVPLSVQAAQQGFQQRPTRSLADVLAHEFGHTAPISGLNDEYTEGKRWIASPDDVAFAESGLNTQVLANAVATGGAHSGVAIDPDRLKWNWERAAAAAEIEDLGASGSELRIVLNAENWARWPKDSVGRSVLLRKRRTTLEMGVPKSDLLVIQSLDSANQVIQVSTGTSSATAMVTVFGVDSVVVMPVVDAASAIRRIVDPLVINALANGPFAPAPGCIPNPNPAPPAIPAFQMPRDHSKLIAAYETAAHFNCGAIRPSADCKMRTAGSTDARFVPVDFCFVCKYVIAETVDPGSHGELDRTGYPK